MGVFSLAAVYKRAFGKSFVAERTGPHSPFEEDCGRSARRGWSEQSAGSQTEPIQGVRAGCNQCRCASGADDLHSVVCPLYAISMCSVSMCRPVRWPREHKRTDAIAALVAMTTRSSTIPERGDGSPTATTCWKWNPECYFAWARPRDEDRRPYGAVRQCSAGIVGRTCLPARCEKQRWAGRFGQRLSEQEV